MSGIVQDNSFWPLVVIRSGSTASNDDEIKAFITEQRKMIARGERFVELADMTDARVVNASQRRVLADWLREAFEPSKKLCAGVSIVVPNPIIRGGVQAVFWLAELSVPMKTAATLDEAIGHCREWLHAENIPGRENAERFFATATRRVG